MADNADKPTKSTPQTKPDASAPSGKTPPVSAKVKAEALTSSATKASASPVTPGGRATPKDTPLERKTHARSGKAKTAVLWFVVVLNSILLALVVAAGYWGWMQWQHLQSSQVEYLDGQQNQLDQQSQRNLALLERIEQQNSGLQSEVKQMSGQLQNALDQANLAAEQAKSAAEQSKANKQLLSSIAGRRPADWLLAEADFLVRMAGRKLWLEHDVKTALMMLQSADSRLQDLDDASLLPIRERLAQDLQDLQQINPVSLSSLALSLGAMWQQVNDLPLVTFERPEIAKEQAGVSGSVDDWRANLARNWQAFTQDFFSFKKKEADVQPYMTEQQQWLAREQLKLALLQAQGAVMQEDVSLYQQALQNALAVLMEDFDTQAAAVNQFTKSLQNLIDTDIEREYPSQFSVAPALQDLIQQRLDNVFSNGNALP